jgi:hypothetical protein
MIGRRAVIGLSLLSALLVCALAAQSASAVTATNTTAFTCAPVIGGAGFSDAHCDNAVASGATFKHDLITGTTTIEGTNEKVTPGEKGEATAKSEPAVLKGKLLGGKVTVTCQKVKNNTTESWIENSEPTGKVHKITGTIVTEFSGCAVTETLKCVVKEPIISRANIDGVEGITGPNLEANAMGLEFKGDGANETFTEIFFENKEKEVCPLVNEKKPFPVKGSVIATSGPTTKAKQTNVPAGATLVFEKNIEKATQMQKLTLGLEPSEFSTIATARMPRTKEEEEKKEDKTNAISLTTVT